jgi:hypothetical protein
MEPVARMERSEIRDKPIQYIDACQFEAWPLPDYAALHPGYGPEFLQLRNVPAKLTP